MSLQPADQVVGNVVRLNSGGPRMTIVGITGHPQKRVNVVCFVDRVGLVKADFAAECLEVWTPPLYAPNEGRRRDRLAPSPLDGLDDDAPPAGIAQALWRSILRAINDAVEGAVIRRVGALSWVDKDRRE